MSGDEYIPPQPTAPSGAAPEMARSAGISTIETGEPNPNAESASAQHAPTIAGRDEEAASEPTAAVETREEETPRPTESIVPREEEAPPTAPETTLPLLQRLTEKVDTIQATMESLVSLVAQFRVSIRELQTDRTMAESLTLMERRMADQDFLQRYLAQTEAELKRTQESLRAESQRARIAEEQRDELKRQMQETIRQKLPAGQFASNDPNAGPSADEFQRSFVYIRSQRFDPCVHRLHSELAPRFEGPAAYQNERGSSGGPSRPVISPKHRIRNILALHLFEDNPPDATVTRIAEDIARQFRAQLPAEHRQELLIIAKECFRLVRNARDSRPLLAFQLPRQGDPFDPDRHEAAREGSDGRGYPISLVLFPGYGVADSGLRVREKAVVLVS